MGNIATRVLPQRASVRRAAAAAIAASLLVLGARASAGEGSSPSDWEALEWTELTTARAAYICISDQPAYWCFEWWESRTAPVEKKVSEAGADESDPPEPVEKPKAVADADWEALLKRVSTGPPSAADFRTMSLRAGEDADPAAMEVIGYAYAVGWGVDHDYAKAYEHYGKAFLAGATHVKTNLDQLWTFLTPDQQRRLKAMFGRVGPSRDNL